jgi:hypothetical protein
VPRWAGNNTNFVTPADAARRFDALVLELVTTIAGIAAGKPGRYATGRSWFEEQRLTLFALSGAAPASTASSRRSGPRFPAASMAAGSSCRGAPCGTRRTTTDLSADLNRPLDLNKPKQAKRM